MRTLGVVTPTTTTTAAIAIAATAAAPQCLQQQGHALTQSRSFVDGKINADADEVAELIESNIVRPSRAEREQQQQQSVRRLLTTRREALSLYREVLRYSNLFVHRLVALVFASLTAVRRTGASAVWVAHLPPPPTPPPPPPACTAAVHLQVAGSHCVSCVFNNRDEHGRVWRDVLRANARAEFEAARAEPDPELINRMIVTGRDAVQRIVEAYMRKRGSIIADEVQHPQQPPMRWQ